MKCDLLLTDFFNLTRCFQGSSILSRGQTFLKPYYYLTSEAYFLCFTDKETEKLNALPKVSRS